MAFGTIFWIVGVVCAAWVIIDVLTKQSRMDNVHKVLWIVAALLFSIITAIVYYFVVKK